jgi:hypothetical protein
MRVGFYSPEYFDRWNQFISEAKNSHFMFNRSYMEYHSYRYKDSSLMVFSDSENIIAVLPANLDGRTLLSHGGLTFGGLCFTKDSTGAQAIEVFSAIAEFLQRTGLVDSLVYKRIPDIYALHPSQEDLYALFLLGATLVKRDLTTAIDLRNRRPMSKMRKRRVDKSATHGLLIEEQMKLDSFWPLLESVLGERHAVRPVHSLLEISHLMELFPENIKGFVVKIESEVVAGAVMFVTDTVAHVQYMASSALGRQLGALDYLLNDLISHKLSHKNYFNFGISSFGSGYELNTGLLSFKEGFGGGGVVQEVYSLDLNNFEVQFRPYGTISTRAISER